eukprot:COSAG01_NODE_45157_length_412_cov_0.594249_1_plen_98_part_00
MIRTEAVAEIPLRFWPFHRVFFWQVAWAPAVQSSARVYEDAGQGLGYQHGEFALSNFTLRVAGRHTVLGIEGGALVLGSSSAGLPPPRWGTAHAPLN